ncbi:GAF and ANTAR domain-containing protein [Pseudonocardia sediminis]|uniref:GAF and ANTAR domain-containing protein n=1 Tax=Pseudonocardia sediminis TaxID=1397368 RepID=UPI003BF8B01D
MTDTEQGTVETGPEWERDRIDFRRSEAGGGVDLDDAAGVAEEGPLARRFAELTAGLLAAGTVAEALQRVVTVARSVIPAADLVSITLRAPDGTFHTPVETGTEAAELDQEQYRSNRGPCLDSAREDGPAMALSGDLGLETRWPEFASAAVRNGYGSVLATTLLPDARAPRLSGALNLYARKRDAFGDEDRDRALLLATHASLALAATEAISRSALQEAQFRTAIASRDVIGQAKGILMARRGLSADEAFDILRRTSQDLNVKLVDLATTLASRPTALDGEHA